MPRLNNRQNDNNKQRQNNNYFNNKKTKRYRFKCISRRSSWKWRSIKKWLIINASPIKLLNQPTTFITKPCLG